MTRGFNGSRKGFAAGFSLLEILVAFAILTVTLGILLQIFGKGVELASTGESYSRALLLAESMLATVGTTQEIEIGESHGEFDEMYNWSINVELYEDGELDSETGGLQFLLYRVQVAVRWESRSLVLETLRIGRRV
jgi:general secretion pathway protein I